MKVFEDFQGTFFKKFLERGMGQRPIVPRPSHTKSPLAAGEGGALKTNVSATLGILLYTESPLAAGEGG